MTEDIEPGAPLMGRMAFDIEKARQTCEKLQEYYDSDWHPQDEPIIVSDSARLLPAALAEIERLTLSLDELKKQLKFDRQSLDCYRSQNIDYTMEKAAQAKRIAELESNIKQLQKVISEPVESFGTPELIAWARKLQKIIDDFPENERGGLGFVMTMGCHLDDFAKRWHCDTMASQAKRIAELVGELDAANRYIRILESKKNQEGLMWACDKLNARIDKQRAALKKLGQAKRERGKALVRKQIHIMYDGLPVKNADEMARQQLRQEGLL